MTAIAEYIPEVAPAPAPTPTKQPAEPWPLAARIAFRFFFIYFGWYVLTTQMLAGMVPIPKLPVPDFGKIPPMKQLVMWVGHHVLNVKPTLVPTGSGDTLYDWTQAFTMVMIALAATVVWSVLARDATRSDRLFKWFRLFLRFALATTMLSYGFAKVFPLQMPTIFLSRLLEPYGNFSPMGVIWYSIGAAPGYERFIGSAEVIGGTLLFFPPTVLLGALVTFAVTTGVWVVNMTYDVPVKLFAFHLVIMSLFLAAPDVKRLLNMFVLNRPVEPRPPVRYGSTARANRICLGAQIVFAAWVLVFEVWGGTRSWFSFGGGAPKSAFYGIWDIDTLAVNGAVQAPLLTDSAQYTHVVFQTPTGVTLQRMDLKFDRFSAKMDTVAHTIAVKNFADSTAKGTLTYSRPSPTRLILEGDIGARHLRMTMAQRDFKKILLLSRGFNWVQELPFNR